MKSNGQRGFTLIELMIVVAIVGVLAAIAIPLFMDSMKRAKKGEALLHLDTIGKKAMEEYVTNSSFPLAPAPITPAVSCCTQNASNKRRCAAVAADWDVPHWLSLSFAMSKEFYFQYSYTPGPGSFQAIARGDLDCDGTPIDYVMDGTTNGGTTASTHITEPDTATD